jgi:protein O-GlcNAc transferase
MKVANVAMLSVAEALRLHQGGNLPAARLLYENILAQQPLHFDALHLLGVLLHQQGLPALAAPLIQKAIFLRPGTASFHNSLGLVQQSVGELPTSAVSFRSAINLDRKFSEPHLNLGNVLAIQEQFDAALHCYEQALALQPTLLQARYNLATIQLKLRLHEEAIRTFCEVILADPLSVDAHYNRGLARVAVRELPAALADFDHVLALDPTHLDALNNRGLVLSELGLLDEAMVCFTTVTESLPSHFEAHNNLGDVLRDKQQMDRALVSYRIALGLRPEHPLLAGTTLHTQTRLCDWQALPERLSAVCSDLQNGQASSQPFCLLSMLDAPDVHRMGAESFVQTKVLTQQSRLDQWAPASGRRIRVGYYSSDYSDHIMGQQMAHLYETHDTERFELFAFSLGPDVRDNTRMRLLATFEHFIDASTMSDRSVSVLSRELGIDIAVDLNGYTSKARPAIFALGCAPVQVSYLGYAGTTGASYMDYLIADRVVIPEESRQHYSEQIVYLPDSFMVNDNTRVRSERQFTRAELGLPEQGFVFRCYNNSYKILPEVFDCWMRLLQQLPGSVLWLLDENPTATANLKREAQQRGVDPARLVFSGRIEMSEHFARNRVADLFLDTFPYTAHSTACDALWSGLPVLTRMGESFASRVAGSLLTAMNLPELITHSLAEYEARALHLAQHPQELAVLRERLIANRDSGPLFDTARFARHIEAAYTLMHQRRVDGLPPAHYSVPHSQTGRSS